MTGSPAMLRTAIDDMFARNDRLISGFHNLAKGKPKGFEKQLKFAVATLLVELASCDENFAPEEHRVISLGLRKLFNITPVEVENFIKQANMHLRNMRGTGELAEMLRDNLTVQEREQIAEIVEEVIHADSVEDGFETYLRHRICDQLGITPIKQHTQTS